MWSQTIYFSELRPQNLHELADDDHVVPTILIQVHYIEANSYITGLNFSYISFLAPSDHVVALALAILEFLVANLPLSAVRWKMESALGADFKFTEEFTEEQQEKADRFLKDTIKCME